jgi:hypothetical protein
MLSRRQILQRGLAASSVPLVASVSAIGGLLAQSAHAKVLDHPALYKVLFDRRFAPSRELGRHAEWQGLRVQGFDGDVTDVWYQDLNPRWRQSPVAIAGLTTYGALFCLERLAWDVGMRVTQRSEQRYDTHEPLYSWVIAPRS